MGSEMCIRDSFTTSPDAAGRVAAIVLVLYITSTIGFDASCIYYDAFLTDVTTEDRMDSVSTLGYGLGYIGGSTIPLLIFLIMNAVGVPMLTCLGFIFGLTAVWWLVFSVPLVKNCEQTSGKPYKKGDVGASIKNVFTTMKEIGADKPMLIYIISYFFYIDGVHTIISMSTSYGTNLGLDSAGMLLALLLVQVLGLPFCLLYMKLAEKFGARTMVGVGICVYMFICVFAFFMNSLWQFWMLAVLCAMLADEVLDPTHPARIGRIEGLAMLLLYVLSVWTAARAARREQPAEDTPAARPIAGWLMALMIVGGLAALVFGGEIFLHNAVAIARKLGVSESVIAITLVAGGTSLPELASSLVSLFKGKADMALGNVIGSNIANILLILGISATIHPLTMGGITLTDILVVVLSSLLLFMAAFTFRSKKLDRWEGAIFLAIYIAYIWYLVR